MHSELIRKSKQHLSSTLSLQYEDLCKDFSWKKEEDEMLKPHHASHLNIGHIAVDRHADGPLRNHIALRYIDKNLHTEEMTYLELKYESNKFSNILKNLGLQKNEILFTLLNRSSELIITAVACWKNKCIFAPLFPAFGPEPILERLNISRAKALITTDEFYQKKIKPIRDQLPDLKFIFIIYASHETARIGGTLDFKNLMLQSSADFEIPYTSPDDPAILHFTSGTTGKPKGALHVHEAVVGHHTTGRLVLDLKKDDIFWCTADPGWVTGTSYGIISPLSHGITSIIYDGEFNPDRWYEILQNQKVTVWYTAPTAIRMMMRGGLDSAIQHRSPHLRFIASVGEPLNPEAVFWGQEAFNLPIHDNWWQTETGGIMIANFIGMDIKPGSMGRPLPGISAAVVKRLENGKIEILNSEHTEGELALKVPWPSMFRAYLHDEIRYEKCFCDGYYLTGDLVKKDSDGYYWFLGRADDVIKSSGHLIGPFEIEKILMQHPAVIEAAAIGIPDPIAFEIVMAFVSLKKGYSESEEINLQILGFARQKLGAAIAPKEIKILPALPKTRSGKIMRRLLKARALGLPEGDTSTLEPVS